MKSRGLRFAALLAAAALVVAACGSDDNDSSSGGDSTEAPSGTSGGGGGDCGEVKGDTINVVQNAWTASIIEAQIMKQLIESQLCAPVEIVTIDENSMFTGLSDGTL